MHKYRKPKSRRELVDGGACGVRLGLDLRAAAEREASRAGICLSHWIKRVVEDVIRKSTEAAERILDVEFSKEMEALNDR